MQTVRGVFRLPAGVSRGTVCCFISLLVTLLVFTPPTLGGGQPPPPLDSKAVAGAATAATDKTKSPAERTGAALSFVDSGWYTDETTWNKMRDLLLGLLKDRGAPLAVRVAAARIANRIHGDGPWGGPDIDEEVYAVQKKEAQDVISAFLKEASDATKKYEPDVFVPSVGLEMLMLVYVARNAPAFTQCEKCGADVRADWLERRYEVRYESKTHFPSAPGEDGIKIPLLYAVTMKSTCPNGHDCTVTLQIRHGGGITAASGSRSWTGRMRAQDWVPLGRRLARRGAFVFENREPRETVNGCAALLGYDDPVLRLNAVMALSDLKAVEAVKALSGMLKDADPDVRFHAAKGLGEIGSRDATPALVAALNPAEPAFCREVIAALGKLRDGRSVQALIPYLGKRSEKEQDYPPRALWALVQIGPPAVPALVKAVADDNPRVREDAAYALQEIKDKSAVPGLIVHLRDKRVEVRRLAARVLCSVSDASATQPLVAAMGIDREQPGVYIECLQHIGRHSGTGAPAIDALNQIMLHGENESVRRDAERSLAGIGVPALDTVLPATKSELPAVRAQAYRILSAIGNDLGCLVPPPEGKELGRIVSVLLRGLEDRDKAVRATVIRYLVPSHLPPGWREEFKPGIPVLVEELKTNACGARESAATALAGIGKLAIAPLGEVMLTGSKDASASACIAVRDLLLASQPVLTVPPEVLLECVGQESGWYMEENAWRHSDRPLTEGLLQQYLKSDRSTLRLGAVRLLARKYTKESISALMEALGDKAPEVREAAASGIGQVAAAHDPKTEATRAVDLLTKTLGDEQPKVRAKAAWALGQIGDRRAYTVLAERLIDADPAVSAAAAGALGALGDERALGPIIKMLDRPSWRPRYTAVEALGRFPQPEATEALLRALKDKDPSVRSGAVHGLASRKGALTIEALVATMGDQDEYVRGRAVDALFLTCGEATYGVLVRVLDHPDKSAAAKALAVLSQHASNRARKTCGNDPEKWKALWQDLGCWIKDLESQDQQARDTARRQLSRMAFVGLGGQRSIDDSAGWRSWWLRANKTPDPGK